MLNNKKILIIGGTGSWGQELTKQILKKYNPSQIIIYSRGEHKQVEMTRKFNNPKLKFIIGDIRNKQNLKLASLGVNYIFHLAALKHVPICERNPEEAIRTNIQGTINAIEVAIENNIDKFVLVSTDKAVDPINVYGVSKSMAEKAVINANRKTTKTSFVCIRAGNVVGTTGSVIPLFKEQILKANKITLTDERMTRYIIKLKDAISLIFKAVEDSYGGEIFVTKMPSIRIVDLAKVMINSLGSKETEIFKIGIRPGEKLHEVLVSRYESNRTVEYGDYFVILPMININNLYEKWKKKIINKEYNSKDNIFLTNEEIKKMLSDEKWLNKKTVKELEKYSKEELLNFFKNEGWLSLM